MYQLLLRLLPDLTVFTTRILSQPGGTEFRVQEL